MRNFVLLICCAGALAACATPEQRVANSQASVEAFFSNPADRKGISTVFNMSPNHGLIYWFPGEVTAQEVDARVKRACGGTGGLEGDVKESFLKRDPEKTFNYDKFDCA